MKNIMKRNTISLILITCLLAFGATQVWAVTYKGSYQPSAMSYQHSAVSHQSELPSAGFQSTSVYAAPEWAGVSMLNADGTVNEGAYMGGASNAPSGPRRVGGQSGTPGQGGNKQPLGGAALPLMLLAIAYCGWRFLRRRKEA